jgi:hypothetical protein
MATDALGIELQFKSSADTKGSEQAAAGVKKVDDQAKETTGTLEGLGYSADAVKEQLLGLVAFAAVIAVFKEGMTEAYNLEKAFRAIDATSVSLGLNTEETRGKVEKFAQAIASLGGSDHTEVVKAISDETRLTNDLDQSLTRVSLAQDISTKTGMGLMEALHMVNSASMGVAKGSQELKNQVIGVNDVHERQQILVGYLEKQYRGATVAIQDNASTIDASRNAWKDLWETVGGFLNDALAGTIDGFKKIPATVTAAGKDVVATFKFMGAQVGDFVIFLSNILPDGLAKAQEKFAASRKASKETFDAEQKAVQVEYDTTLKKSRDEATKELENASKTAITFAHVANEAKLKDDKDYQVESLKVTVDEAKERKAYVETRIAEEALLTHQEEKELENRKGYAAKSEDDIGAIHAKYRGLRLIADEKLEKELETVEAKLIKAVTDDIKKQKVASDALEEYKLKTKADKEHASEGILGKYEAAIAKANAAELLDINKLEKAGVDADTAALQAHQRFLDAKELADRTKLKAELELNLKVVNSIIDAYGAVFGESKALSIAQTVINTAVGIMAIWATSGMDPYEKIAFTIIEAAAGVAAIAKISSTDYSASKVTSNPPGFDSPSNDYAAYVGGGTWARHMVNRFQSGATAGFSDGLMGAAGGGGGNSTTDNRRTFNVNMYGASFLDPSNMQQVKQFYRALTVVDRQLEQARVIGRTTR